MTKTVKINIWDASSVQNAIYELEKFQHKLEDFPKKLVSILLKRGVDIARYQFENAVYAGENDTKIHTDISDDGKSARIYAMGQAVLFIEFGTGVFKDSAMEEVMNIQSGSVFAHGEYGKGKAKNPKGWAYVGNIGKNPPGDTYTSKDGRVVRTMGNHANSSLWNTRKALQNILDDAVREAWNDR